MHRTSLSVVALTSLVVACTNHARVNDPARDAESRRSHSAARLTSAAPSARVETAPTVASAGAETAPASAPAPPAPAPLSAITSVEMAWTVVPLDHTEELHVAPLLDGGALVLGHNWQVQSKQDFFLERRSPTGALVWRQQALGRFVREVTSGADAAYVLTEYTGRFNWPPFQNRAAGLTDLFLGRVSLDGTLVWGRTLATPGVDRAVDVATTPDGGAVVLHGHLSPIRLGSHEAPASASGDPVVSKWDAQGEPQWVVGFGWSAADPGADLAVSASGQVAVVGTRYQTTSTSADARAASPSRGWVSVIGADGTKRWLKELGNPGEYVYAHAARWTPEGEVLVTGSFIPRATMGEVVLTAKKGASYVALLSAEGEWLSTWQAPPVAIGCLIDATRDALVGVNSSGLFLLPASGEVRWLHRWTSDSLSINDCATNGESWFVTGLSVLAGDLGFGPFPAPELRRFHYRNSPAFVVKLTPRREH